MQYITTLNSGRQFAVESNMVLSPEQINNYAVQKMQGGGCASARAAGGIMMLGTCGGTYTFTQNTSHDLTGSITSGGTSPFTYSWTITKPDAATETKTGAVQTGYAFTQVGTYKIVLTVTDSCPVASDGPKTDTATCNVVISAAACVDPECKISIA